MFSAARGIEYWITGQLGDQIDQIHSASENTGYQHDNTSGYGATSFVRASRHDEILWW